MVLTGAILLLAYLLGSVPSSVWLGRWLRGIDLREHGSGNAGATNAFRVLGIPIGIAVLVVDMAKGFAAVSLSHIQQGIQPGSEPWMTLGVYALAVLIWRISSLGSLAAVLSYPLWMILVFKSEYLSLWVFSILAPILVIITYRSNIKRLIQGKEA